MDIRLVTQYINDRSMQSLFKKQFLYNFGTLVVIFCFINGMSPNILLEQMECKKLLRDDSVVK